MAKPLVAAGFIIFRRFENALQYLLLQTSYGEHHWSPPKGHTDPGESELETARRETEEESGYKVSDLTVLEDYPLELNYNVKGKPKRVVYWLAKLVNPEAPVILSSEHINYKWLELKDACECVQYKDMQETLTRAQDIINNKTTL